MSIFEHSSYRKYLEAALAASGRRSGSKSRAAEAMDTQPAFLSRVLAGQAELSLEQADKLSRFLGHDADEHHFFLLLVQHNRAGSSTLKTYFQAQIEREKQKRKSVSDQIKPKHEISPAAESRYYSSWVYAAIHVLLSIETLQTAPNLAQALNLPQSLVAGILRFLAENGLAKVSGDRYSTGPIHLHLRNDSDQILRHHANWRMKAMETLTHSTETNVRYSAVLTLDEECASAVRESLVENLRRNVALIEPAPAQTAYVYTMDFFPLFKP